MSELGTIAIVGASLAGLRAAEFIRRAKFTGRLIVVGDEQHAPYDRPPLSKELLRGEWDENRIALRRSEDDLNVDWMLGSRAVALDTTAREVRLASGQAVPFDGLVIATGGVARTLPAQPRIDGVFTLRTLDDALAVRASLRSRPRVAVVGAGFIGAEVAASARQLGLDVTMIEALSTPLASTLGPTLGGVVGQMHEKRGVRVLCGRRVDRFVGRERVRALVLDDGTEVDCDVVMVGVGMKPSVSWLEGSGVEVEDGVHCDETLSTNVPDIVAAGDVASWYNPLFEERMRVEHWTNAVEQARHAVRTLLSGTEQAPPFESVPLFWSDQFDVKIQGAGRPKPTDDLLIERGADGNQLVALYSREGRLTGAVTFNQPPKAIRLRMLLAKRGGLDDARAIAAS
jgi:NADPH-dependent 2,4-dienoyl-CoA reductase/sulfur reductase-like enzyme